MASDKFELKLEEKLKELRDCQKSLSLNSCSACDSFFECELRKEYVKAVYGSMAKDRVGGFEFG